MANKLTPAAMLSLPQPGAAQANPSGTAYIMPWSHFDFGSRRTTKNVAFGQIPRPGLSSSDEHAPASAKNILENLRFADVAFLDDNTILYLRPRGAEVGKPDVDVTLSDKDFEKQLEKDESKLPGQELWCKTLNGVEYKIGYVPVTISDLKITCTSSSKAILVFSAAVYPEDPSLDSVKQLDEKYERELNGAEVQVYDKLFVRQWDTWTTKKKKLVFYLELEKKADPVFRPTWSKVLDKLDVHSIDSKDDSGPQRSFPSTLLPQEWSVLSGPVTPLAGLENIECPVGPRGDSSEFDVGGTHLAFVSRDPHLPEAWHTRMHCYIVPLHPRNEEEKKPKCLTSQGGARRAPVFSPSARIRGSNASKGKLAWLESRVDTYGPDRYRVMIYDLDLDIKFGLAEDWDLTPESLAWGWNEATLYVTAKEEGHERLFALAVPETPPSGRASSVLPQRLTTSHSVSSVVVLSHTFNDTEQRLTSSHNDHLLVTINSFTSPNEAFLLDVAASSRAKPALQQLSKLSTDLTKDLLMDAGEEFWFTGAAPDKQVHGFIFKTHGYEKGRKYGLIFLVHGGPQAAWTDSWWTYFNPHCWTAAGYVAVMINPTGSVGYGQDFVDAIYQDVWDLFLHVIRLDFVKRVYGDMIDAERMVMAGGSYGGYMCNWMQGHNDILGFKAFICHDGILNMNNVWFGVDLLCIAEYDMGGTPWQVPQTYEKWSPHNHIRNWKTPQLVFHGGLDYRIPLSESIGMFNALQRKGIPSRFVYFPKENHAVWSPLNSQRWYQEVLAWMDEWIGHGPSEE